MRTDRRRTARRLAATALAAALGLALAPGAARAVKIDLVLAVDETGGMAAEIAALQAQMAGVNDILVGAGHDVAYGLVSFAATPTVQQDLVGYTAFTAPGGAFQTLTAGAVGTENGSLAASAAATLGFRPGSVRAVFLFSDEANQASAAETQAAVDDLVAVGAELWAFVDDPGGAIGSSYFPLVVGSGAVDPLTGEVRLVGLAGGLVFGSYGAPALGEHASFVPEPGASGLLALGLVGLAGLARRVRPACPASRRTGAGPA